MESTDRRRLLIVHRPALRRFVRRLVSSDDDADDLLQDVAVVLFTHRTGPIDSRSFPLWCRGVARYLAAHRRRSFARRTLHVAALAALGEAAVADATLDNPEHLAVAREQVAARLDVLDERARTLFVARFVDGETPSELAERWRVSPASMRMRLMRLRTALRVVTDENATGIDAKDG